jgi:3-hydroxyisobutyrate dehydrogenase
MLKDLKLAQDAAASLGVETSLGSHAAQIYGSFKQRGQGASDFSAIIHFVRGESGLNDDRPA